MHDPLAGGFPQSREGRLLFLIAVVFSLYQISTALNLFGLPSQVMRSIHLGFLLLLTYTLIGAAKPRLRGHEGAGLGARRSRRSASRSISASNTSR